MVPQSHSPLGFFGIVKESFETTSRNLMQLLYPMLLLVFLSYFQFDFAQVYMLAPVFAPVAKDLKLQLPKHPNMFHKFTSNYIDDTTDVRDFLLIQLVIVAISSIITVVVLIATVSSSSEAYTAKPLALKYMFLKLKETWKRSLVTSFYMILLTSGIVFLYLISIVITSILGDNSWGIWVFGPITLSIPVCYLYVATLWIVSMVVSVLEEGVGGLKAIWRASELMKGKKLIASLMMVLFAVAYSVVHLMVYALESYNLSMTITIPFRNVLFCWLKLFMFVVYTVFYHEWKTSHDEKEGKGFYLPIAAGLA